MTLTIDLIYDRAFQYLFYGLFTFEIEKFNFPLRVYRDTMAQSLEIDKVAALELQHCTTVWSLDIISRGNF